MNITHNPVSPKGSRNWRCYLQIANPRRHGTTVKVPPYWNLRKRRRWWWNFKPSKNLAKLRWWKREKGEIFEKKRKHCYIIFNESRRKEKRKGLFYSLFNNAGGGRLQKNEGISTTTTIMYCSFVWKLLDLAREYRAKNSQTCCWQFLLNCSGLLICI